MSPSTLELHHLAVVVADLDRAEAFYAGVLGLPVVRRWDDAEGRPRAVWVELGEGGARGASGEQGEPAPQGAFLALERSSRAEPLRLDEAPGWHCVALGIAATEREAWRRRLEAGGIRVERESAFTLYFRDPDGNLLGLSHYPVPSAPTAGGSGPR